MDGDSTQCQLEDEHYETRQKLHLPRNITEKMAKGWGLCLPLPAYILPEPDPVPLTHPQSIWRTTCATRPSTVVQLFTVGGLIRGDDTGPSSKSYAQNVGGVVVFTNRVILLLLISQP